MDKSGLNQQTAYKYTEVGKNQFEFYTFQHLHYSVYFLSATEEYFSHIPNIPDNIFLFGFELLTKTEKRNIFDPLIEITVINILKWFFTSQSAAIIYLCNVSDKKQRHRKITFNKWFKKHNSELHFEKIDHEIIVDIENQYYISLIVQYNNPDKEKYLLSFSILAHDLE